MSNNPLVSIIVPIYGTEDYLPACIDSIRNQSYSNIQIILVDDQSPDKCPEICDDYASKDDRIVVIHQKNKGVSGARNTGLDRATGEYIMFVDSDDTIYPDAIKTLVDDALLYNADVVSGMHINVDKNGEKSESKADGAISVYDGFDPLLMSLNGDRSTQSACMKIFRTSLVGGLRFIEGQNINEDGFFVFQCYAKKPLLVQHNVVIYQYNFRENSGSRQKFSDKYLSMLYFCECKRKIIEEQYPQYIEQLHNTEVRTNLFLLDVMCSTKDKKYKQTQKLCVKTVRKLHKYHRPINDHHKMLALCVRLGLYPLYKLAVRFKYYR